MKSASVWVLEGMTDSIQNLDGLRKQLFNWLPVTPKEIKGHEYASNVVPISPVEFHYLIISATEISSTLEICGSMLGGYRTTDWKLDMLVVTFFCIFCLFFMNKSKNISTSIHIMQLFTQLFTHVLKDIQLCPEGYLALSRR